MTKIKRKYDLVPLEVPRVETKHRRIVTKIPVPESIPILNKMEKYEPIAMQGQPPIVIDHSESFYVYDKWGNKWIDYTSGVLISNVGNSNPAIRKSLKEMLDKPLLSTYIFAHEKRAELVEQLALVAMSAAGCKDYKVFLLTTGSEAVENCIKLAKTYGMEKYGPKKRIIISYKNGFHGRTMGSQLAGGVESLKKWLGKSDDSFIQVPFPDGYENKDMRFELFLETLEDYSISEDQVCGVIAESFQGHGPDFFPVDYAKKLESWCRKNDVLLVMDEVQSGFGRTGKWFTFEHYGIKPDLITCGKGITSSLPLSAVIGRGDIPDLYPPGSMTSTHSGSPLPVAAALANMKLLKEGPYIKNAEKLGKVLHEDLVYIKKQHSDIVGYVQSLGLVGGIHIINPATGEPDGQIALEINKICNQNGLLMYAPVGVRGECVKIAPPLVITEDALKEGLSVLMEAIHKVKR